MEQYDVHELNIDVRRFASFGVVKVTIAQLKTSSLLDWLLIINV